MTNIFRCFALALALMMMGQVSHAQEPEAPAVSDQPAPISAEDGAIEARLSAIFAEINGLSEVDIQVRAGVVTLSGMVNEPGDAAHAVEIASNLEGVVTVQESIERDLAIDQSLSPAIANLNNSLRRGWEALPLVGLALVVFLTIAVLGHLLGSWMSLWRRVTPNPFLAELVGQAVRIIAILIGLVMALNLVGATALMGAILGGAGVIGLAIGFAVRDTVENYISSIMLSLRQPFRAGDHVLIDDHEGKVVRLTSRATILMTLDGNHLRIPNATVFKAIILNYTRNPERRFEFELGVDAEDDPVDAMATGLAAINPLDFVLDDPKPDAIIVSVGDSNIIIRFTAWIDQDKSNFGKARSLAIRAAKDAVEEAGFTLPEPIYRLRFDNAPVKVIEAMGQGSGKGTSAAVTEIPAPEKRAPEAPKEESADILDVRPDSHIDEKVAEERAQGGDKDLLDSSRPVE